VTGRRGRPPIAGGKRPPVLFVRMPAADLAAVQAAAKMLGQNASEYAREVVVRQARADLGPACGSTDGDARCELAPGHVGACVGGEPRRWWCAGGGELVLRAVDDAPRGR
jgi:hypothetical protein